MAFAALTIDLNARLAKFEQDMAKAGRSLDSLNSKTSTLAAGFKSAFGALAAGLSVGALASFAKSGIDAADALNDMSQKLGVSVKDLASLKLIAEQSGTSLESVGTGMARFTKSIGEAEAGNNNMAEALKSLGVSARDPKEAFYQLADAVQRIQDPSQRAALLSQVLGKSYGELVPLLNQGSEALRESAKQSETFAESMARLAPDADKFNDQLALMKTNAAGAAAQLLNELVPAMNKVLENVLRAQKLSASGFGFLQMLGLGVNPTQGGKQQLDSVQSQIRSIESDITRLNKNSGGQDSSIAPLQRKLDELKALRQVLIADAVSSIQAKQSSAASGGVGGSIDIKTILAKTRGTSKPKLDEIDPFYRERTAALKAAADQVAETERMIAEHLQSTNDELYLQAQAWTEAGRALESEMRTPLENANIEFGRLDDLLERGAITWETYSRAVLKTQEAIEEVPEKLKEMDNFAKTAAENIQNSFADFLFDPFAEGLDGMLKGFGQTIQRMIADAVAADLARWLFGDLVKGGNGGGLAGGLLSSVGELFSFAGGGYTGPGSRTGGIDGMGGFLSVLHPNETVIDHTKGQRAGGGTTIVVNVNGSNNAPDVRRAAAQGAREALGMFEGARRYA